MIDSISESLRASEEIHNYCMLVLYSERLASLLLAVGVISRWLLLLIYHQDSRCPVEIAQRAVRLQQR